MQDIALQQAIAASLISYRYEVRVRPAAPLAAAPTRSSGTSSSSALQQTAHRRSGGGGGGGHTFGPAGVPSAGMAHANAPRITRDIAPTPPQPINVPSGARRRNTLERQGIVPASPAGGGGGGGTAATAAPAAARTKSNPAGGGARNIGGGHKPSGGLGAGGSASRNQPQGGARQMLEEFESAATASFGGEGGGAGGARGSVPTPRRGVVGGDQEKDSIGQSSVAAAYAHLGAPFRSAAGASNATTSRPQQQQSSGEDTFNNTMSAAAAAAAASVSASSSGWIELRPCLEAGGKISRQNPAGSHLVIESAKSSTSPSATVAAAAGEPSSYAAHEIMAMVGSEPLSNLSRGALPPTASSAVVHFSVKPMSKSCSVIIGVVSSSQSASSGDENGNGGGQVSSFDRLTGFDVKFLSSATASGSRAMAHACDFSVLAASSASSSVGWKLSPTKTLDIPQLLKAAEANTSSRFARAKNSDTDWPLIPVAITISSGALQLDACGETIHKNIACPAVVAAGTARIFIGVSGRCTLKDIKIGDVAEIKKQQLLQTVNSAANPLVALIENELLVANPNTQWEDVCGLQDAKRVLNETVILPNLLPELFSSNMRTPWTGVLCFGVGGTGKTMLAKAVATSAKMKFFTISAASLMSKYVGEAEKLVKTLFAVARRDAPSIIFFDEVDSVMTRRGSGSEHDVSRRLKTQLLQEMDGVTQDKNAADSPRVVVIATTNKPWDLDDAFIRRMEKRILITLPDSHGRLDMILKGLQKMQTTIPLPPPKSSNTSSSSSSSSPAPAAAAASSSSSSAAADGSNASPTHSSSGNKISADEYAADVLSRNAELKALVEMTHGYSGADINIILRDACMMPLRRKIDGLSPQEIVEMKQRGELNPTGPDARQLAVAFEDVVAAIKKQNPSISQDEVDKFAAWNREFGST